MKNKFLLLAAMLFAAIALTGCDPTETPDDGDNTGTDTEIPDDKDGDGGGNNGDIRLVDKMTFDDGNTVDQFFYDDQNRVIEIRIEGTDSEGHFDQVVSHSYGENTVTCTVTNEYGTDDEVFNLDSEGRISSDEYGGHWSYNDDGYWAKYTRSHIVYDGRIIVSEEEDYFWSDGYLTKIESTLTTHYVDESQADQISKATTTYTYGDLANPAKVSLDMNADVIFYDHSGYFSALMGSVGKSPKNLVSSSTYSSSAIDRDYTTNYTWELDSKGYITKLTTTNGDGETYITTVTYKN